MLKHTHTHLPVENDAPDEAENELVIAIDDIRRTNVHQFNLRNGEIMT